MTTGPGSGAAVAFWQWWRAVGADATAAAIADGDPTRVADEVSQRVAAIDAGLQWELVAGRESRHLLVVTAAGDPALRATARGWLLAAPPPDDVWSYADLRPPDPDAASTELEFAGHLVELGRFVVAAHLGGSSIDVSVHHPVFQDVGDDEAAQLTYLALDAFLGEETTETWIGEISWPSDPPLDAFPLQHLRTIVSEFTSRHRSADGQPPWAVLQGVGPTGSTILAMAQIPLRQITFPLFDTHVGVTLPFADRTEDGLPGPSSLDALRVLEERISAELGPAGRIVAHQSSEGVRLLHLYVDAGSDAADRVARVAAAWDEGDAQTIVTHDPGWSLVQHLAG